MINSKKTKIICTIGPASESPAVLEKMAKAGMNACRLNFSHGEYAWHENALKNIRAVSKKTGIDLVVIQDLCGPKIRVGELSAPSIKLKEGGEIILTSKTLVGDENKISVSYPRLARDVKKGDMILLEDGTKRLEVAQIKGEDVVCKIIVGGELKPRKGVNLPGAKLSISALTEKDKKDILWGIENGIDFIALSFVRSAKDIFELKSLLEKNQAAISVIAKIEKREAIENLGEIINAADAVMVARGDLGIEASLEEVPFLQKLIIRECLKAGKPVITATQMLESMVENSLPTRAEATDVANAILDGTDAIMLSEEAAVGKHPVEAVAVMNKIAKKTEQEFPYAEYLKLRHLSSTLPNFLSENLGGQAGNIVDAITYDACEIAASLNVGAIVSFTESGSTAKMIARFKPKSPIIAITPNEATLKQLNLSWNVYPVRLAPLETADEMIKEAKKAAASFGLKRGQKIVISAGIPFGVKGSTNLLLVQEL